MTPKRTELGFDMTVTREDSCFVLGEGPNCLRGKAELPKTEVN